MEQATQFSGFDPVQKKMLENRCGNLQWIPFEEDGSNYGLETNLVRPIWDGPPGVVSRPQSPQAVAGRLAMKGRRVAESMKGSSSTESILFVVVLALGVGIMLFLSKRTMQQTFRPKKTARMVV
jgi:hypothetical protein